MKETVSIFRYQEKDDDFDVDLRAVEVESGKLEFGNFIRFLKRNPRPSELNCQ